MQLVAWSVSKHVHDAHDSLRNVPFYSTGSPADMINVRMQNDVKLPANERRNYKNAIDGLIKVYKFEGSKALFNGASMATLRAIMMTIGQVFEQLYILGTTVTYLFFCLQQISVYDQFKYLMLKYFPAVFEDTVPTHLTASTLTGAVATSLTQPVCVT